METKQVIVMRKDLNMRKGKMIAQGSHASLACLTRKMENNGYCLDLDNEPEIKQWLENSFAKITVSVDSEEELYAVYENAKKQGLNVQLIEDSGRTEFGGVTTPTCLCIGPHYLEKFEGVTSELKLL